MPQPIVTIVLPTYNRPDVLAYTVRAVIRQSLQAWRLLVIGDHCAAATAELLAGFDDPRIHYVNLPERWGEQAGPNSIGMRLADTPYVAMLNHDDLWLADHLQVAIDRLEASGDELYLGRAAFAQRSEPLPNGGRRPCFTEQNAEQRNLQDVFTHAWFRFEPTSSWVFRRSLVDRVGAWRPARELYRVPLQDWLLRAWRAGVRTSMGSAVTVLKINTHYQDRSRHSYDWGAREHHWLERLMTGNSCNAMRDFLQQDLARSAAKGYRSRDPGIVGPNEPRTKHPFAVRLLTPAWAVLFHRTGLDSYTLYCWLTGKRRGALLRQSLQRRTGEQLPTRSPDMAAQLRFAQQILTRQVQD